MVRVTVCAACPDGGIDSTVFVNNSYILSCYHLSLLYRLKRLFSIV